MTLPTPSNILQNVQTYQKSDLAFLQNMCCFLSNSNTKFKDFQKLPGQLGATVTFDRPPRATVTNNLVITFQPAIQEVETLTVDQQFSSSYAFTAEQFIFNVEDYMNQFGRAAIQELGAVIEANIALNAISGVVNNAPASSNFGTLNTNSGPFRFYGNGRDPINSYSQLSTMLANFRNWGSPMERNVKVYLSDLMIPGIVNTSLSQFVPNRNEENAQSWMIGSYDKADFFRSNLLPVHTAGTVGNSSQTLTLVSTNDTTGNNVTQLTFSGATASDAGAIVAGDLLQFNDGVSGKTDLRYLTIYGHVPSSQPVQFRATANAAATGGGQVTISIYPALCWASGNPEQNLNTALVAGMQADALPTHRAGLIVASDAMYLAMPRLPDQRPYDTSAESDAVTGVSLRHYYGAAFGKNQQGYVRDAILGSLVIPLYSMRIVVPV